jgi:hypothetical protein
MPRRHLHTYRPPKPVDDAVAELERILSAEQVATNRAPVPERAPINYRRIAAVIGLVILGLAAITFILTLRSHG